MDVRVTDTQDVIVDGVEYTAAPYGGCGPCAFKGQYSACDEVPCTAYERLDGREVIFVLKQTKPPAMDFNQYQEKATAFAEYESDAYPFFALPEETGEFLGLIAKAERGDDIVERYGSIAAYREKLVKEAGDILWQLSQCLREVGISMQEVAEMNIAKLTDRAARGVIKGVGDNR